MKKLSVTAKITIWYTIFLVFIATVLMALMIQVQAAQERSAFERELAETITDVSEKIEDDGSDFIYDDSIEFYIDGTYISIYDAAGELIEGRRPAGISVFPAYSDKTAQTITDIHGTEWYVYDSLFQSDEARIWIRGIKKHTAGDMAGSFLIRFLLFALPGLILIAAFGGFVITRRAFRPLRDIIRTTDEIRADADVSRRIPRAESHDELSELTDSINGMFDSIEDVLEREKQFSSDVSHELRTPIAVIQSQSEYALEEPDYREKALTTIHEQARQMSSLVNRLLTLSRSDSGTLRLAPEEIDLSELLKDIAEQQQLAAADEDIEITTDIADGIRVIADEGMLIQVILNLISNAVKYGRTPSSEEAENSSPAGKIRLSLTEEDGFAFCTVADSGPGIPEEEQSRVWDRFYQIDRARSGADSSAGLGLSMVKALTASMGGSVSLQSEEGKGAAFTLQLPVAAQKDTER